MLMNFSLICALSSKFIIFYQGTTATYATLLIIMMLSCKFKYFLFDIIYCLAVLLQRMLRYCKLIQPDKIYRDPWGFSSCSNSAGGK